VLQRSYLRWATAAAVRQAQAVIAVSAFTARELSTLLEVAPERVHVVHHGVDPAYHPRRASELRPTLTRLRLEPGYILSVATRQPRKNLGTLLAGYSELRRRLGDAAPELALVGGAGWGPRLGPPGPGVRVLGYVAADVLPEVYGGAGLLAFPSWYEGFGMPLAEALASGTPAVIANAGALPEVAGGAALAVPPGEPAAWADALEAILTHPDRAATLRLAGLTRAARFTWARAARETVSVYQTALRATAPAGAPLPAGSRIA
jgi:alpha-1,3-rhamnosyl/mannosyltransferase